MKTFAGVYFTNMKNRFQQVLLVKETNSDVYELAGFTEVPDDQSKAYAVFNKFEQQTGLNIQELKPAKLTMGFEHLVELLEPNEWRCDWFQFPSELENIPESGLAANIKVAWLVQDSYRGMLAQVKDLKFSEHSQKFIDFMLEKQELHEIQETEERNKRNAELKTRKKALESRINKAKK